MNKQRPAKLDRRPDGVLFVHSIFRTIQGEGPFAGVPAVFVRLAGCNLSCPGCDTEYTSYDTAAYTPKDLYLAIKRLHAPWTQVFCRPMPLVVLTGGEPLRQNIGKLLTALSGQYRVQVETNGTLELWGPAVVTGVTFVCSPKTPTLRLQKPLMNAFKYVVDADHISAADGLPTVTLGGKCPARPPRNYQGPIYIQPEDCGAAELTRRNVQSAVAVCRKFGYTLSLQIHKLIGLP